MEINGYKKNLSKSTFFDLIVFFILNNQSNYFA